MMLQKAVITINHRAIWFLLCLICSGCSVVKVMDVGSNIPYGILNSDDLETTKAGLPSYLLMLDGLLETYPESKSLLMAASSLNGAYAGVFVEDEVRARRMANKAFNLAVRAMCVHNKKACNPKSMSFSDFEDVIGEMRNQKKDVPVLYSLGTAWAGYVQSNSSDWNVIADLAKVSLLMEHIYELDMSYENGMVPLYLGVLNSLLPPALGGKPEIAKTYFEQGIELSQGQNLMIKVLYAEKYAKLTFNRQLHDKLLNEVLNTTPHVHGLTLQNVFAQKEAQRLLEQADEYF
ncbi:TRAP transporter TatT component family protein [Vibrio sp. MACH09]|uniref:TRAP transporter TatT component family protein n=1 Tax=Vibrio sp. MACH09 TaxID=3025122 RepID=UPI00295EC105|nr:TRAP transporter TatT component family protein [Vibrio sp. MACH09]